MRASCTHIDKYGVTHEVRLIKAGYGGASTELRGSAGFLRFQHDNLNEANPFATPIQNGRLEFGAWIESVAGDTVVSELLLSQEGDWTAEWYSNSVLFWKGIIEPDLTVVSEGAYPYEIRLTAKDVTYLSATSYPINDERKLAIVVLAEALNSVGYNLPIRTRTSWVCEDTDTAEDFLRQVYVQTLNLRDFGDDRNTSVDDVAWTHLRVIEEMARAFKLFIRQTDGYWLVEQMSAHASPASVLETIYTSAGVYSSDSNIDPTLTANTDVSVVLGSNRQTSPAFGFVQSTYAHRSRNFGIRFLSSYDVTEPLTFAQNFVVDGTQNITFTGTVQSKLSTPLPDSSFSEEPYAEVEIRVGDLWYDGSLTVADWVGTATRNRIKLFDTEGTGELVRDNGTALRENFGGSFNIITKIVPTLLTAGDTLTIIIYPAVMPIEATTKYLGLDLSISNNDGEKESRSIKYELSQSGDFSLGYDDGLVYFGSGPTTYSPGALLSSATAPDPLSNSLITNWNRRGTTPDRILAINLLKETLDQTRGYRGILEASIRKTGYTPSKTLEYDGKYWFYIGGTFDGFSGDWTVVFKENALATATDTQVTIVEGPGTNVTSNLLQAVSSGRNESIEASASDGMRLALEASGTISQIQVYDRAGYVEVKAGQVLRIVNPVTLTGEQVTASADRSGDVITVDSVTLTDSYPAGAYVFLSAESLSAGIAIGENAVRIYAEGQKVGRLNGALSGLVTSIPCFLNTKVVKGTELQVVNSTTGDSYSITVASTFDTYGPGSVTLNVEAQLIEAPTGSYIVGDNAWQSSAITVTQGLIVLKVDSNGRVAQVKLSADQDSGSEITISAEQVNINGIIFTEGTDPIYTPGDIATSNYVAGSTGWAILGDGTAEFNDVTVRGTIESTNGDIGGFTIGSQSIETTVTNTAKPVAGYPVINNTKNLELGAVNGGGILGVEFDDGTYFVTLDNWGLTLQNSASNLRWLYFLDYGPTWKRFSSGTEDTTTFFGYVSGDFWRFKKQVQFDNDILVNDTTDSSSKDTGSIVTEGGLGVEKSAYIGANLRVLGTTDATSKDTGSLVVEGGVGIEKNLHVGGVLVAPTVDITPVEFADSPYSVGVISHIATDSSGGAITINLPTGTTGRRLVIFDGTASAGTNNVTINRASTDTINGATSYTLNTNYQSVTLVFYSGNWTIIT